MIEPEAGDRKDQVAATWEFSRKTVLGEEALNEEKMDEEGEWAEEHIVLGYRANVQTMTIALPGPKREGAKVLVWGEAFDYRNQVMTAKTLQTLRGV